MLKNDVDVDWTSGLEGMALFPIKGSFGPVGPQTGPTYRYMIKIISKTDNIHNLV